MARSEFLVAALVSVWAATVRADLREYVERKDSSFAWEKRAEAKVLGVACAELRLVSQTWRGITWKHRLVVARPADMVTTSQAMLILAGGSWRDAYDAPAGEDDRLPREAQLLATIARQARMPTAMLLHVPFQPMFDGKKEDAIIAYTFERFITTGEKDWPLLLPMVKSAVRAMDAVQAFGKREWSLDIEHFTVTGGSKRGWTTWLTAAMDKRVNSIAPMVIDVLNMGPQMKHQLEAWGRYSDQIHDYTQLGIQGRMATPEGRALTDVVDPYAYRKLLTMPKLILLGTNDRYWPVDALNLYWDGLPGEKHVVYVPNKGHSLNDLVRVVGGATALALQAAGELTFPTLDWQLDESDTGLRLTVRSDRTPARVVAWVAHASTRDFRDAKWKSTTLEADGAGAFVHRLARPASGYTAVFGEAVYDVLGRKLHLSTNLRVIESLDGWTTLFSGKDLSGWNVSGPDVAHAWRTARKVALHAEDPRRLAITAGDGILVNGPQGRTRDLYTDAAYGDCELHVEFNVAKGSNSGVYLQGRYEIQILDSFGKDTVGAGDCGGVYERWIDDKGLDGRPPDYNASKPAGMWQTFDITFRAPRFDAAGNKIANARFEKVKHNGIVVHESVELKGPTRSGVPGAERPTAPVRLQGDHGPVAYRNLRIRPAR